MGDYRISRFKSVDAKCFFREQQIVPRRPNPLPVLGVETLPVQFRLLAYTLGLLWVGQLHRGAPYVKERHSDAVGRDTKPVKALMMVPIFPKR